MKHYILSLTFLFILSTGITTAQVENTWRGFNGENTYIEVPNFQHASTYTIQFWVYTRSDEDGQNFVGRYTSDGSNRLVFGFYNGGIHVRLNNYTYQAGEKFTGWAHLALEIERDGQESNVTVYKNGSLVWTARYATSVSYSSTDRPWVIGMDWDGDEATDHLDGFIDEFVILNSGVNPQNLASNYNKTVKFSWPGVAVYYPFQPDNSDISGYDRHATIHGGQLWGGGAFKIGKPDLAVEPPNNEALAFNGIDGYIEIGNESNFDLNREITVEAWIKVDSFDKNWQAIVTKGEDGWRLHRYQDTGQLAWDTNGLSNIQMNGRTAVDDGEWHHVVAIYDAEAEKKYLFIDGQLDASATATGNINNSDAPVLIGENADATGRYFKGMMANVRVWNWAVPLGYQNTYMNSQSTVTSLTRGHWPFDGSNTDFSNFSNHGILHGGVEYEAVNATTSTEEDNAADVVKDFTLSQNYPNPFNPTTTISYQLPVNSTVSLSVFNTLGREVATLVSGDRKNAGNHTVTFDASTLSSGIYFYTLKIDGQFIETKKMLLVK